MADFEKQEIKSDLETAIRKCLFPLCFEEINSTQKLLVKNGISELYKIIDKLQDKKEETFEYSLEPESTKKHYSKDYTKYNIFVFKNNEKILLQQKISKRNLLYKVIYYLVTEHEININKFSKLRTTNNPFNRCFASKNKELYLNDELPSDDANAFRYTVFEYKNTKFSIITDWDKNSVEKLINWINSEFQQYLVIEEYKSVD